MTIVIIILCILFFLIFISNYGNKENCKYNANEEGAFSNQTRAEKRRKERLNKKEIEQKAIDKCTNCVLLNYIDTYYALSIRCKKFGNISPPYACNYFYNKNIYSLKEAKDKDGKIKYEIHKKVQEP